MDVSETVTVLIIRDWSVPDDGKSSSFQNIREQFILTFISGDHLLHLQPENVPYHSDNRQFILKNLRFIIAAEHNFPIET
jgi:hypothetical protein